MKSLDFHMTLNEFQLVLLISRCSKVFIVFQRTLTTYMSIFNFNDFVMAKYQVQGAAEMFDRLDMLEEVLMKFFSSMRITKKVDGVEVEDYPKKTYLKAIKSHLKMHIFNVSVGAVDI